MKLYSVLIPILTALAAPAPTTAADPAHSPSETSIYQRSHQLDKTPSLTTTHTTPTLAFEKRCTPIINIILGNKKQHVGNLTGQGLYDKVHDCLWNTLCPTTTGNTQRTCKGPTEACRISDIWYNLRGRQYRNSHLDIKVANYNFPVSNLLQVAPRLLIEQIAGTFKVSSENEKNCYQPTVGERGKLMCNVGNYVNVFGELSTARMNVTLNFNGDTTEGKFDCAAVKLTAVEFLDDKLMGWWKGVLQVGTCKSFIQCESNEVT